MSKSLAISSALSVLMMASFALFSQNAAGLNRTGTMVFNVPAKAELAVPAALPSLPGLR